jgi:hypothetical protein
MKILFPGLSSRARQQALMQSPFYKKTALWYLRSGAGVRRSGEEELFAKITGTRRWAKNNPYWKLYARNRNVAVAAEANPLLYKQYLEGMKQNFESVGLRDLPDDYYRTFYKSRYASESGLKELQQNLQTYGQAGASYGWFQGKPMDTGQVKTATLDSSAKGQDLRARLGRAFGTRGSFLSGKTPGFESDLDEQRRLVQPTL